MPAPQALMPQVIAGAYKCYVGGSVDVPNPFTGEMTVNALGNFIGDTADGFTLRPNAERIAVTGDFHGATSVAVIDNGMNPTLELSALEWNNWTQQFLWPKYAAQGTDWNAQVQGAIATAGRMYDDMAYTLILVPVRGSRAYLRDLDNVAAPGRPLWVFPKVWPQRDGAEQVFSGKRERRAPVVFSVRPCQGTNPSSGSPDVDMAVFFGRAAMV